jgi:drug/metabolite transporter (DMT)-like permease
MLVPAMREKFRTILFACSVAVLWAAIEVIGAWLPDQPSLVQVVWIRYATHLLLLLLVLGPRYRGRIFKTTHLRAQLAGGLLMLGMPFCFIVGVHYLSLSNIWTIFWFAPLGAMLLAVLVLHEKPTFPEWLAVGLAFVGVVLIIHPNRDLLGVAMVLPIGMGVCFGLYMLSLRLLHSENIVSTLFYTAVSVFVPLSFGLPFFWHTLTWTTIGRLALIGLLGLLLLYSLDKALALGSVALVAPFLLSTPLWMLGFDVLLFHPHIRMSALFGCLLLAGALIGLAIYQLKSKPQPDPDVQSNVIELRVSHPSSGGVNE